MERIRTCELRLGRRADVSVLARMSRDYIEQGLRWRWRESALNRKIAAPETTVIVAEVELAGVRFTAGFAVMDFPLDKAVLNLLAVNPSLRRHQIGSKLLRWLHKSARVAECQHIELQVRADNHTARSFYRRHGYREEALLPRYYDARVAAYQMKLRLLDGC